MVSIRLGWQNHSEKPLSTPNLAPETRLLGDEACRLRLLLSGDLVAIHKPPGLSTDAALRLLSARCGTALTRVSRLDLATSGVLLAAVGEETKEPAWPAPYSVELWDLGWVVTCRRCLGVTEVAAGAIRGALGAEGLLLPVHG